MNEHAAFARQATFNTEPADFVSGGSIRRGSIELPVVDTNNVTIKTLTTSDENNNDDDCENNNNNNNNNYSNAINQESDNESNIRDFVYDNNTQQTHAPRSNQSSPIYGSRSAYEKFNKKYAPTLTVKSSSICDDLSDLEILSDVGLADDSDYDVKPVITPLSLSARRKTRKAPRIKLPSAKVDNTEPTIHEERTQDFLSIQTPESNSAANGAKLNVIPTQARSQTVVVEKRIETVPDKKSVGVKSEGIISENGKVKTYVPTTRTKLSKGIEGINGNSTLKHNGKTVSSGVAVVEPSHLSNNKDGVELLNLIKDDLESSFCESDWQPRRYDSNDHTSAVEDRKVIAKRYDNTFKQPELKDVKEPLTAREAKSNPLENQRSKRPLSAGDNPQPKEGRGRKSSRHLDAGSDSRPPSRPVKTPIISNFLEEGRGTTVIESTITPEKNTNVYSGIPRRAEVNQREEIPQQKLEHNNIDILPLSKTPNTNFDTMDTSDGYDYESETFEEILKDRNAMVKAERTYQKRIKQLEEELKGMIKQCQALSDENKELRKNIDSSKRYEKDETGPGNNATDGTLSARIAKLETEKENLVKINERLSIKDDSKRKQSDVVFVENTKLKNKNIELEKKVHSLQNEIESLSSKVKEHNSDSGNSAVLDFKNKELEVTLADLRYENKGLVAKVKTLENDKHLITNTLEEKRIEINEMMRAMQSETSTETELKQSRAKLEGAQGEINSVKSELEEMKRILQESESKKSKLQNTVGQRETEIRRLRGEQEHKDKIIVDLRSTAEKFRDQVAKHEENRHTYKEMERETGALKSRIGSLKAEIESSLTENQKLKYEREEANKELDKLRNENVASVDAVMEGRRYFRKWETERETRNKAEVELAKKQDEIGGLRDSLKQCGTKMNVLYGRVRAADEDREKFRGPNAQELDTNNKILKDENKKLRQMLIERNIELVNKTNEKEVLDNRVGILERKQKDSDVRVRQLTGWVGSMASTESNKPSDDQKTSKKPSPSKAHLPPRPSLASTNNKPQTQTSKHAFNPAPVKRTGVKEPIVAVISPRSRKKRTAPSTMTPPPKWDDRENGDGSNHTPLSLPVISDSKPRSPTDFNGGGYFQMYKERMKKVRNRQFPLD